MNIALQSLSGNLINTCIAKSPSLSERHFEKPCHIWWGFFVAQILTSPTAEPDAGPD